jgi:hypothetical protein
MSQVVLVVLLLSVSTVTTAAQTHSSEDDLKKVAASGMIKKNVYSNEHVGLRLALPEPPCDPKLNTKVDVRQGAAILLECEHGVKGLQGTYTLTVAIDYRANYPAWSSLEQYVRGWRHAGERENRRLVQTEQPRRIAGMDFVESILSSEISPGRMYYEGIACTQMKVYLVCFVTAAPSVDEVRAIPDLDDKLELIRKPTTE